MADSKFRVRTIKIRKQIAQGLALPLNILKEFTSDDISIFKEGDDVTDLIGVTKYEPRPNNVDPISINRKKLNPVVNYLMDYRWFRKLYTKVMPEKTKGTFPEFIRKTDEERLQSNPTILKKNIGAFIYSTEKLDGSSASYFFNKRLVGKKFGLFPRDKGNGFGVCSRNIRLVTPDNRYWWSYARNNDMEFKVQELCDRLGKSIAIQGELIGLGIQENKYKLSELDFYCFNLFDIENQIYITKSLKQTCCDMVGIKTVPIDDMFILKEEHDINYFINLSNRKSAINNKVKAEGIVVRGVDDETISFKVINPEWLLKNNE
jgi:RNA ligase (TIGR02306 family)